ncbi:MAG: sulfur carrier protein ThiS [Acidobacteria bacterium]|nr:sulfur carrier protein ThiS [Acidobacteriota bacterium]
MDIVLNGEPHKAPDDCTVLGLLESLAVDPSRVAVELDGQIISKPVWPATLVRPGAQVEVVMFVGGGSPRLRANAAR